MDTTAAHNNKPIRAHRRSGLRPTMAAALVVGVAWLAAGAGSARAAQTLQVCPTCQFQTIQSAVTYAANNSGAGDTITVAAGVYDETVSVPSGLDGLTIDGVEAGVPADSAGSSPRPGGESVLDTTSEAFDVESSNVAIDGFRVTGGNLGVWSHPTVSGLRVLDTVFTGEGNAVVPDSNGASPTLIRHDAFFGTNSSAPFEPGDAILTGSTAGNLVIEHNLFVDQPQNAIIIFGERGSDETITDNTAKADAGGSLGAFVTFFDQDQVTVAHNVVSGETARSTVGLTGTRHVLIEQNQFNAPTDPNSMIYVGNNGPDDPSEDVDIEANDLSAPSAPAVLVTPDRLIETLHVHYNRIIGGGIENLNNEPIDATDNWWGCNAGPGQSGCSANTTYAGPITTSPWLVLTLSGPSGPQPVPTVSLKVDLLHDSNGNQLNPQPLLPPDPVSFAASAGSLSGSSAPLDQGAAHVQLTADEGSTPAQVTATLDGQRVTANVAFVPDVARATTWAGDFGSVTTGQESSVTYLPVTDSGALPLAISRETLGGTDPGDFTVAVDGCAGQNVQPAASCELGVRFTPTGAGLRSATLTLVDNEQTPSTITLTGVGVAPNAGPQGPTGPGGPQGVPGPSACQISTSSKLICVVLIAPADFRLTGHFASIHYTLMRGRTVYALGSGRIRRVGTTSLTLGTTRHLQAGHYQLTILLTSGHRHLAISRTVTIG